MSILKLILLIAAGIGAALGIRSSKSGEGPGLKIAIGCAVFAMVLAVSSLMSPSDQTPKLVKSIGSYGYASGVVLGRHLAETYPGSRALVLTEPVFDGAEPHELQRAMLDGLKEGMGSALEIVDTVAVDPPPAYVERARRSWARDGLEPPEGQTTNSIPSLMQEHTRWFDVQYFAHVLDTHQGTYDVLISTVGLPKGFSTSKFARNPALPDFALMNAPGERLKGLIEIGAVDVVVADKPSANPWKVIQNAPGNVDEAFEKRYVLVTKDNLAEVVAAYPASPHWH